MDRTKRKNRFAPLVLLLCAAVIFTLFAVGCGDKKGGIQSRPSVLSVPTVTVDGVGLASWAAVPNASGYAYIVDGGETTATNDRSVLLHNGQSIRVKAVGDGKKFIDSEYCASVLYTLPEEETTVFSGTTEVGATVTLTTDAHAYNVTADNGEFSIAVPKTETPLSIASEKYGYFTYRTEIAVSTSFYELPLVGSVTSSDPDTEITGDSFSALRCSYYKRSGGKVNIRFTDPAKDGQVIKLKLTTFGGYDGKLAHGAASNGTPLNSGTNGLSDIDGYFSIKIGSYSCRFMSDGSTTGLEAASVSPYLSMFTALAQETDSTDFAIAFDGGKTHYFAKQPTEEKYMRIGRNNATPDIVELSFGGYDAFALNLEFADFVVENSATAFIADAITDGGFTAVNSAVRRNGDGSVSAVIGDGSSSGYLCDRSRSYDLTEGTLTLKTKVYSYGGSWQFHGFYIVDRDTDKHYNIGITQGNNIWLSWSNEDRDFNGFPGRVPVSDTSCRGTFGSYNNHGGWLNSSTAYITSFELKLVLNGELADLFLDGKRIVRVDVRELFDKNTTSDGKHSGAASTVNLPSNNVCVGLYAFSDPGRYRTLFDGFTAEFSETADIERKTGDSGWKTQIYNKGVPLFRNFVLNGNIEIASAGENARAMFGFGDDEFGLFTDTNGTVSAAYGKDGDVTASENENDKFDSGFGLTVGFELAVTDNAAALFIDGALRLVYNGIGELDPVEFYALGCDMSLTDMNVLLPGDDGYDSIVDFVSETVAQHPDVGFANIGSTRRSKPVIGIASTGTVTVTQAENAELVYSIDGCDYKPYAEGIVLKKGQRITVKALGDGKTVSAAQASAVYYEFEAVENGGRVTATRYNGTITVTTCAEAREEVFIIAVADKADIYSWLDGGALAVVQTAADGNGTVTAELETDAQSVAWVFVITEGAAYAVEVK